ncbi:MAG: PIN domain-containing protein [Longimicrobiaceae bacterium]
MPGADSPIVVDANILFSALLRLCRGVDPGDEPFVALTLALDGRLWTGDQKLRRGLVARGFDRFFDPE